jgi:ABC-type uncharacterized transport system ATPase subunit
MAKQKMIAKAAVERMLEVKDNNILILLDALMDSIEHLVEHRKLLSKDAALNCLQGHIETVCENFGAAYVIYLSERSWNLLEGDYCSAANVRKWVKAMTAGKEPKVRLVRETVLKDIDEAVKQLKDVNACIKGR